MATIAERALASVAYLKAMWDLERKDIMDLYLPFLAELVRRKNYEYISEQPEDIARLTDDFMKEFGLKISYHAMLTILNRARKKKIFKKESHKFFVNFEELNKYEFNVKSTDEKIKKIIEILSHYAKTLFPHYSFRDEDLIDSLFKFLEKFATGILLKNFSLAEENGEKRGHLFVIAKVIQKIYEVQDADTWKLLEDLVAGYILSKMIFYDPSGIKAKLSDLNIYLDTRIIFRLIGVEGEVLEKVYKEFVGELKKQCIKLYIFRHTFEEIMDILNGCYEYIDSPEYDPSKASLALQFFKEKGWHQSDIILLMDTLEEKLKKFGIEVKDNINIDKYEDKKDFLKSYILMEYEETPYFVYFEKESTIKRDVLSVLAVYQLRKQPSPKNLKEAKHVFITTNLALAKAVKSFHDHVFGTKGKRNLIYIPACIPDTLLGTIIWLNNPTKISDILPTSLVSLTMAVTQHSQVFISRWHQEILKLLKNGDIDEDTFILLRDSPIAKELLDAKTLGDPNLIDTRTVIDIQREIEQKLSKKYEQELIKIQEKIRQLEKTNEDDRKRLEFLEKKLDRVSGIIAGFLILVFVGLGFGLSAAFAKGAFKIMGLLISGGLTSLGILYRGDIYKYIKEWIWKLI